MQSREPRFAISLRSCVTRQRLHRGRPWATNGRLAAERRGPARASRIIPGDTSSSRGHCSFFWDDSLPQFVLHEVQESEVTTLPGFPLCFCWFGVLQARHVPSAARRTRSALSGCSTILGLTGVRIGCPGDYSRPHVTSENLPFPGHLRDN